HDYSSKSGERLWERSSRRLGAAAQRLLARERELAERDRAAEQEALRQLASGAAQEGKLLRGLDTLGRRIDVERAPEPCDRAHDRGAVGMARHALDERLVDLDLVEREHLQVAHRGIADPEIVEHDRNSEILDLMQDGQMFLVVIEEHSLGNFELQPACRQ